MATTAELPFPHPRKLPNNVEVRECKAAISVLDQNIEDVRMQMQKLEKQLEDLDRKRANYVSYISPFRWLPVEILGEIANICLYNGTNITTLTSIHSTLRNAIIGMQSLWRHVRLMAKSTVYVRALSYDYLDATITYVKPEQLEMALTRAGSVPLHLDIYLPVEHEMLELISLRQIRLENVSITSLGPSSSVSNLNLSSLRELRIDDSYPDIPKIMDMALNSTRNDLELYLTIYEAEQMVTILTHPLLQRITLFELYLTPPDDPHPLNLEGLNKFSLPKAKKLSLFSGAPRLDLFDLRSLECLEFEGNFFRSHLLQSSPPLDSLMTTPLPTQLVELNLARTVFTFLEASPYCLPNLTNLTLFEVGLRAPLRWYLQAPTLKVLSLDFVVYNPSDSSSTPLVPPLFDKAFFESTPELQDLSISEMTDMVENLVENLRCCLSLRRLKINRSPSPKFIQSFSEEIQDQGFLPNLAYISIRSSWAAEVVLSYMELKEHSRANRPGLDIQGDDLIDQSPSTFLGHSVPLLN